MNTLTLAVQSIERRDTRAARYFIALLVDELARGQWPDVPSSILELVRAGASGAASWVPTHRVVLRFQGPRIVALGADGGAPTLDEWTAGEAPAIRFDAPRASWSYHGCAELVEYATTELCEPCEHTLAEIIRRFDGGRQR